MARTAATVNPVLAGSVQSLVGNVNVHNTFGLSTINADDSADTTARTVDLSTPLFDNTQGRIDGLAPGLIQYTYANTSRLYVTTGKAADTVNVMETGVLGGTFLSSSGGRDVVNAGDAGYAQGISGATDRCQPDELHYASAWTTRPMARRGS